MLKGQTECPIYDFGIIGCGPVGLYAGFYAGYHGLNSIAFDLLPELGGQLINLYPEKWIFDVGGHVKILAKDYIDQLLQQSSAFSPEYHLNEKVIGLEPIQEQSGPLNPRYKLITEKREVYCKCVLIAGGMGAYLPRKLELPNIEELENRGVHYRVTKKEYFQDKRVMIVGGGDSAVDWAINLHGIAKKIWAVHRSRQFKALEANVIEMMKDTDAEILVPYEVKQLHGEDHLIGVTLIHSETGNQSFFEIDEILLMIGLMANLGPIETWGLQIQGNGIVVDRYMQTNLPAVYAIGDIAKYDGKVNLIAAGHGETATAIEHSIATYFNIEPRPRDWLIHSNPHDQ
ncbi:MAG: NAD(P)/FAD-dependent oxidoreductase [bacterium]|nr:NAD(P)/FAD-dependent oxidoreductase [bacterium]